MADITLVGLDWETAFRKKARSRSRIRPKSRLPAAVSATSLEHAHRDRRVLVAIQILTDSRVPAQSPSPSAVRYPVTPMPSPDRLARDLVRSSLEFHGRRPWREICGKNVFLMRVPTEDEPLAVNVMGQGGEEYGLGITRGNGAFRCLARIASGEVGEGITEGADLLSLTFDPLGAIPDAGRELLRAAGVQLRREQIAPIALTKRPHHRPRPARRADQRTLLWVVKGVLAAHEAGELGDVALDSRGRQVLELELGGKLRQPSVVARRVPWPEDPGMHELSPLATLPGRLEGLSRLDERWEMAFVRLDSAIRGDERTVSAAVLVQESTGLILGQELVMGSELAPVAAVLANALRELGLPRAVVFASRRLHGAFAPALAGIEVDALREEESPAMLELIESLRSIGGPALEPEPEAASLHDWKQADGSVVSWFAREVLDKGRDSARARRRYFGTEDVAEEVFEQLANYSPHGAFVEWLACEYRPTVRSRTVVEKRLERKRLGPVERALLEARRASHVSIYRVDASEPGASLEVEDVLTGRRLTVHDRSLSGCDVEGLFLPLRLFEVDGWTFASVGGPPLTALTVDRALHGLERLGLELTPEGARKGGHLFGRLWGLLLANQGEPSRLTNTDGDPLELVSATFHLAHPAAFLRALAARPDVTHDEEQGRFHWTPEHTILAYLEVLDDRLIVEVNSPARLERLRAWLEELPGVRFERSRTHELDPGERPLDDRLPAPPADPPGPEELEMLREAVLQQYMRWVDEKIPALGDVTPREACATEEGRRRVARLVRAMPAVGTPAGPLAAPREAILRELGLSS